MAVPGRLRIAVELVPEGSCAADIGCDHGWTALALTDKCRRVIAADISRESLEKAAKRALDRNGHPRFETRLGDGLSVLSPGEADCLVITGMSGETIASILTKHPEVLAKVKTLVLQPVQGQEFLRAFLMQSGWRIREERLSRDGRHTHVLLACERGQETLSELALFAGPRLLEACPDLFPENLSRRLGGLLEAQRHGDRSRDALIEDIRSYLADHGGWGENARISGHKAP